VDAIVSKLHAPHPIRIRGFVVVVALVALLVMALSASALIRSVQTATAVSGNLGFMLSAQEGAADALEHALALLLEQRSIANLANDDGRHGYFASRQPGESPRGVPLALQTPPSYPQDAPVFVQGDGNTARFVIERMCVASGPATPELCTLAPVSEPPLASPTTAPNPEDPPQVPIFRVSIRVDGPGGAGHFSQAWLADIPGHRRLAWRVLAD
jgi:type IV pilus assembly protein PilX